MMGSWSTDIRWSKLRQWEYGEPNLHVGELKKCLQTTSDDSDEEWLAQLEKDYANTRYRRRGYKWSPLERNLSIALFFTVIICICLASMILYRHYHVTVFYENREDVCLTAGCVSASHNVISYIDTTVDPCADFYNFTCGNWLKNVFLPPGRSKWTAFHQVAENNQQILRKILERGDFVNGSSSLKKVSDFYKACNNKSVIESKGSTPLLKLIRFAGSWNITNANWSPETWSFGQALNIIHRLKSTPLFYMFVGADDKNSSHNIIQVQQSGISLPDEEFYYRNASDKVVKAYLKFMVKIGILLGGDRNATIRQMKEVFDFEKELAKIYEPKDKLRDTENIYHKMTIAGLQQLAPAIPWLDYMNSIFGTPVTYQEPVVVYTPVFLKNMSDLVTRTERRILANYMVWHLVKPLVGILSKPFRDATLELLKAEKGIQSGGTSWKSCVAECDSIFGFATGHLFIKERSGRDVKLEAQSLIRDVKSSFISSLPRVRWMDRETKKRALEKASSIVDKIGYPSWIENIKKVDDYYKNLTTTAGDHFQNYVQARIFYHKRMMDQRGRPVDRSEWHMTPTEVNAYYNSPSNYIAFPSGILQRPFFDQDYPKSLNYGSAGVIVGHELTHGFDSQGRLYNKFGNLANWWKNDSINAFKKHSECLVKQYANFTVAGQRVDGRQTLAENIADNGGLKFAFKAFKNWMKLHGRENKLPALEITPEQLFFIGFGQVWCSANTAVSAQQSLLTDSHSPERVRVLAAVANSPDFAKAFKCPLKSPLNPPIKCQVW